MEKELDFTDEAAMKLLPELFKHVYDYFKHLTTLNTGSLLIIIALLKGVFKEPEGLCAVLISICCFPISLLFALMTLGIFIRIESAALKIYVNSLEEDEEGEKEEEEKKEKTKDYKANHQKELNSLTKIGKVFEYITMGTFFVGIGMFLVFAFINFID